MQLDLTEIGGLETERLRGKKVSVLVGTQRLTGNLYNIDPISKTVILFEKLNDVEKKFNFKVIYSDSVGKFDAEDGEPDETNQRLVEEVTEFLGAIK